MAKEGLRLGRARVVLRFFSVDCCSANWFLRSVVRLDMTDRFRFVFRGLCLLSWMLCDRVWVRLLLVSFGLLLVTDRASGLFMLIAMVTWRVVRSIVPLSRPLITLLRLRCLLVKCVLGG